MALKWLFFKKNCKNCPAAMGFSPMLPHMSSCLKCHPNGIKMLLFFFQKKNCWNCQVRSSYMSFCSRYQKCSKRHPNGAKIAVLSQKKLQELPSGWGLHPHHGNLFSRTQSSQLTTFKIIITGFLNKQML